MKEDKPTTQAMAALDKILGGQETSTLTDKVPLELIERMPNPVVLLGRDGSVQYLNRTMEQLFGYSLVEIKGRDFVSTFVPERDQAREREVVENLIWLQQPIAHKSIMRTKEGSEEVHGWSAACFLDSTGRSSLVALFGHHERGSGAVEQYLKSTGQLLEAALENLNTELVILSRRWKVVYLSRGLAAYSQELLGNACHEVMARRQKVCEQCPAMRVCESEREVWEQSRHGLPERIEVDNPQCPWASVTRSKRFTVLPVIDCTGDVIGTGMVMTQDGGQRLTDEKLLFAHESLNALLLHSLDGIVTVNPDTGVILEANGRACSMLRTEKRDLLGTGAVDMFLEDSQDRYRKLLDKTLVANRDHFHMQASIGKPNVWAVAVEVLAILVHANGSRRLQLMLRDVSRELLVKGQLRSQASLLQNVNDAIITVDPAETVLFWNKKAESVYGLKAEEAICRPLRDVIKYEFFSPTQEEEAHTSVTKAGFWRGEVVHHNKHGAQLIVDSSVSMILDEENRPSCIVIVVRDITRRKESERQLKRRGDEMAALYEIGKALSRHLSLKDVLSVIHTQVSRLMYARNFYIALYDKAKDEVYFPVYVDELVRKDGTSRKAKKGYTEYVIQKGESLLLSEDTEEKMAKEGYEGIGPQALSWLGVPLNSGSKVVGMMAVQSYSKSGQYGEDDLRILSAIADQAAVAIENARMFERLRTSEETYRNLVEGMTEGYIVIQDGTVALANRALAEILSYTTEELVGMSVESLFTEDSRAVIAHLQGEGRPSREEWKSSTLKMLSNHAKETELRFKFIGLSYEGSPALVGVCPQSTAASTGHSGTVNLN